MLGNPGDTGPSPSPLQLSGWGGHWEQVKGLHAQSATEFRWQLRSWDDWGRGVCGAWSQGGEAAGSLLSSESGGTRTGTEVPKQGKAVWEEQPGGESAVTGWWVRACPRSGAHGEAVLPGGELSIVTTQSRS